MISVLFTFLIAPFIVFLPLVTGDGQAVEINPGDAVEIPYTPPQGWPQPQPAPAGYPPELNDCSDTDQINEIGIIEGPSTRYTLCNFNPHGLGLEDEAGPFNDTTTIANLVIKRDGTVEATIITSYPSADGTTTGALRLDFSWCGFPDLGCEGEGVTVSAIEPADVEEPAAVEDSGHAWSD